MFLRFTDVFVIHPVIYKKDAYVPFSELNAELWSCIRKDRHNKNKASKQEKEIIKDKASNSHLCVYVKMKILIMFRFNNRNSISCFPSLSLTQSCLIFALYGPKHLQHRMYTLCKSLTRFKLRFSLSSVLP
jgi:hypothetical protein